jgi:putative membrane protein
MAGLSVLGSIFTYYRFELHRTRTTFTVFQGLLTRHEINLKKSRIQALKVRRDWLDMALGRMNVILQQIRHADAQTPGQARERHILVPSVEHHHTEVLIREALADIQINDLTYTGISRRYFVRGAIIIGLTYFALASVLASQLPFSLSWLSLALPVFVAHLFLYHLHWKRWGVAVDGEFVVIRRGVVGVDHIVIPAFKIQEAARVQTALMRRHGLSSITLSVASTSVSVPFLRAEEVRQLIDYCLFVTEATDRSWM